MANVVHDEMKLSPSGEIVQLEIEKIPTYHNRVILDEWVVMPNHFHLIIELRDYDFDNGISDVENDGVRPPHHRQWWHIPDYQPTNDEIKQYRKFRRKMIIPKIMGKMKMLTSKQINTVNDTLGKKNWQKDYHDHVIRDDRSYQNISNYIRNNPLKWQEDTFHPENPNPDK